VIPAGAAAARAPSTALPLSYLLTAAGAFVLAALGVPWLAADLAGHYYHPRVTALVHVATLGWITLTIMGASYQLVPIVLERALWSERLARWQLPLLGAGIAGMVGHFYLGTGLGLAMSAALVALAAIGHAANLWLSVRGLARWGFTARLMAFALGGLVVTAVSGLLLGTHRVWPFLPGEFFPALHAHFHLALLGWIAPVVFAVAARVYPMFLLAPEPGRLTGTVQLWGLGLGAPAVVLGLLGVPALLAVGALALGAAGAAHVAWVVAVVRARKRPALDWGLRFVLTGVCFLVPATLVGLALAADLLSGPRAAGAYVVLALGGWVSLTIVGMMLKIVPFLVWYRTYGPVAGRSRVPTLAEMSWPAAEAAAYGLLTLGLALLAGAVLGGSPAWIRGAGLLVAAGALAFAGALARILRHLAAQVPAPSPASPLRRPSP
jgi:hypothetical protein